jgi:hypothetical protein
LSIPTITPVAKSLYLCDGTIGFANQKTDLMGLFNAIRPPQYPHRQSHFVVFAQLLGGLGQVPFYIDVRYAADGSLVHSTKAQLLYFPNRDTVMQLAYTIHNCRLPQPGIYLVELCCNGQWVADTTLKLL